MRNIKYKFVIIGCMYTGIVLLFIGILVKLQVVEQPLYQQQLTDITSKQNVLQALRGRIFDRNIDTLLAYNKSTYQIILDSLAFDSTTENVNKLAQVIDVSPEVIYNVMIHAKSNREAILLDNLEYTEITSILEQLDAFEGVKWKRTINRRYTYDNSLAHVIGYVGRISAAELQTNSYLGYHNADVIGKVGIEKQYEDLLRGKTGTIQQVIDVFGQEIDDTQQVVESIVPGNDLILTIDRNIQHIAEKALGERVGAVVVLKPTTGEVLAMVSYPTYNPNFIVNSFNSRIFSEIQSNTNSPFLNRVIQSAAPPASTFKVLMSLAFLSEDTDNVHNHWNHTVNCPGYIMIGNRIFRCWVSSGHGFNNYLSALAVSCNVFFYSIGTQLLGVNAIDKYANMFGFGHTTGIDLPGEVSGILPSPKWKESRYNEHWQLGDTANLSIGQGYVSTTPIQLALFVSAIVNEGVIYKPHILKEAHDQVTGKVVYRTPVEVAKSVEIDKKVFRAVKEAMRGVVTTGTSKSVITTKKVEIAAKTGSGQVAGDDFSSLHSWFLSYGPYNAAPEDTYVIVTWVDASNEWEWWAPKATNIIYEAIFGNQSYEEAIQSLKKVGTWYL